MPASQSPPMPDRPAKTCARPPARAAGRTEHASRVPGRKGKASLDPVRADVWQAFRHLFPPHSLAAQTPHGGIVVSWSVQDDPSATAPYAAPILIKLEDYLVDMLFSCDAAQRLSIARHHEQELRAGLRGYDPYAAVPRARVVVIG